MPVTPLHFGPGAALHALAPRRISFLAFCAANVLIDLEPLYFMLRGDFPLHRFWHTLGGVALLWPLTVLLFLMARRGPLPDLFGWRSLAPAAVTLGAGLGLFSHLVLDSLMHGDIEPLQPFSARNPLQLLVSLATLHAFCLASGVAGGLWLWWRGRRQPATR